MTLIQQHSKVTLLLPVNHKVSTCSLVTRQRTPCLKTPGTSGGLLPAGWELPSFFPASRPIGLDNQHKVPNGQPEGQQGCHE